MDWGAGGVQVVILVKWSIDDVDQVLEAEIEVYEFAPKLGCRFKKTWSDVRIQIPPWASALLGILYNY